MKQFQLNKLLRYWQKRLRLRDWVIKVGHIGFHETDNDAQLRKYRLDKDAYIMVDKLIIPMPSGRVFNVEKRILHELLEIYLSPITKDNKQDEKEVAINMITEALVGLKNEKS